MPPQLEKNHVVPTAWQDEALASLAETFLDYSVIFHEGAGFGNMSDLTGALLASAQLLPFLLK